MEPPCDLLVLAAFPPELAPLRAVLGDGLRSPFGGHDVAGKAVGIGLATAAAGAASRLAALRPRGVVLVGTCGAYGAYGEGLARKIGFFPAREGDVELAQDLLARMAEHGADFTLTFRRLCDAVLGAEQDAGLRGLFADPGSFDDWSASWRARLALDGVPAAARRAAMRAVNPAFIPRNHLIEEAIAAAVERADFAPFETLLAVLVHPYDDNPAFPRHAEPPRPEERVLQTFCGT